MKLLELKGRRKSGSRWIDSRFPIQAKCQLQPTPSSTTLMINLTSSGSPNWRIHHVMMSSKSSLTLSLPSQSWSIPFQPRWQKLATRLTNHPLPQAQQLIVSLSTTSRSLTIYSNQRISIQIRTNFVKPNESKAEKKMIEWDGDNFQLRMSPRQAHCQQSQN